MRIDKYLWAVRIFKTRSEAVESCRGNKVKINGVEIKPSRDVKPGDEITLRRGAILYTYKIIALVDKRQPAKNVPLYIENLTPEEELNKSGSGNVGAFIQRKAGNGRPTKKERRALERLFENTD